MPNRNAQHLFDVLLREMTRDRDSFHCFAALMPGRQIKWRSNSFEPMALLYVSNCSFVGFNNCSSGAQGRKVIQWDQSTGDALWIMDRLVPDYFQIILYLQHTATQDNSKFVFWLISGWWWWCNYVTSWSIKTSSSINTNSLFTLSDCWLIGQHTVSTSFVLDHS